jgi:hypothetical protein
MSDFVPSTTIFNDSTSTFSATTAPIESWTDVASDSTGQFLAACGFDGVWLSSDYGATWTQSSVPTFYEEWFSIASNSYGQYLFVVSNNGGGDGNMYLSSNYGSSWEQSGIYSWKFGLVLCFFGYYGSVCCSYIKHRYWWIRCNFYIH